MERCDNPRKPILLVDDEQDVLDSYVMALRTEGMNNLVVCSDPRQVESLLASQPPSLIVLDLAMPHVTGQTILETVSRKYPDIPVIVVTGSNSVELAVRCMREGAVDYMVKPVEKSRLVSSIRNALDRRALSEQVEALTSRLMDGAEPSHPEHFSAMVTRSDRMHAIFRYIESVAPSPMPVLITGESGVGKELVAQAIHAASGRTGRFVAVNAAGLDDTFFSDTLFGHRKGAFTGADATRQGLIEQAAGGTLFLDEIGDLQPGSQTRLLRLLQQREYYQLGSDVVRTSDARVIAATNADLDKRLTDGSFRKDLYYRLRTHRIEVPPLRERVEDIPVLVDHFVKEACRAMNKRVSAIPPELSTLLATYHFPGNVRELQAMVHDAVSVHQSGMLSTASFKDYLRRQAERAGTSMAEPAATDLSVAFSGRFPTIQEMESLLFDKAMEKAAGNQSVAAVLLGVSQSTLSRRLRAKV